MAKMVDFKVFVDHLKDIFGIESNSFYQELTLFLVDNDWLLILFQRIQTHTHFGVARNAVTNGNLRLHPEKLQKGSALAVKPGS